jgi:hypothetical protein
MLCKEHTSEFKCGLGKMELDIHSFSPEHGLCIYIIKSDLCIPGLKFILTLVNLAILVFFIIYPNSY